MATPAYLIVIVHKRYWSVVLFSLMLPSGFGISALQALQNGWRCVLSSDWDWRKLADSHPKAFGRPSWGSISLDPSTCFWNVIIYFYCFLLVTYYVHWLTLVSCFFSRCTFGHTVSFKELFFLSSYPAQNVLIHTLAWWSKLLCPRLSPPPLFTSLPTFLSEISPHLIFSLMDSLVTSNQTHLSLVLYFLAFLKKILFIY